jgi:hypothetical protein
LKCSVVKAVNDNATAKGYQSWICDAVQIDNLAMDLSAIDAENVTVELKLTVDAADLPEGVTDNAFFAYRITGVNCKNAATE